MRGQGVIAVAALALLGGLGGCRGNGEPVRGTAIEREMTVTAYCACKKCCNWKRTWYGKPVVASGPSKGEYKKPGRTASGEKARRGTIAASSMYPFGTVMDVPGYGRGVVRDRGSAIRGEKIDVFFERHRDALAWGRQRLRVKVWTVREAD